MATLEANDLSNTRLLLLGASNVNQELANLANFMGFKTTVVDDDSALLSQERFAHSDLLLVDDMKDLSQVEAKETDMICVVTRGHSTDPQGFTWALGTQAFYVGMMGSAKKNAKCFAYALEQGISQERIDWAHAPIGIKMDCSNAKEIALSIITELVKVHNEFFPRELDHDLLHRE